MDTAIVSGVIVLAIILFSLERVPLEVASLSIILMLALSGVLTVDEAFAGFSNQTVIFIFALLSMSKGLASTGVMQLLGRRADFVVRFGERGFLAALMSLVAAVSSFASNTAITAAFLPVATAAAARARLPASRVLMPLAHASMLGGTILLFGTSTNLVVSEAMAGFGLQRIGFTELAPVGLPVTALSILWTVFVGRHLLPTRKTPGERTPLAQREYVTEAVLTARSRYLGRPLASLRDSLGLPVLGVVRGERWLDPSGASASAERLARGDRLVLRGDRSSILKVKDIRSLMLRAELRVPKVVGADQVLAEALVPEHSPLLGQTLLQARFTERFGVTALALHRHPAMDMGRRLYHVRQLAESGSLANARLSVGDGLLLSGPRQQLRKLADGRVVLLLGDVPYAPPRYDKALIAVVIFATVLMLAGSNIVAPALAGVAGMLAMIATGCMESPAAFRVEWRVVLLIGSLMALGLAMEKSGTGDLLARNLISAVPGAGPALLLFIVMVLTSALSAPMSNQAAALVMLPVGLHVAHLLGVDPRPFAIGTCLAASCSFMTPLEPSAALVYGPGHYRFRDFLKVGTPLTALTLIFLTLAIPRVWPF